MAAQSPLRLPQALGSSQRGMGLAAPHLLHGGELAGVGMPLTVTWCVLILSSVVGSPRYSAVSMVKQVISFGESNPINLWTLKRYFCCDISPVFQSSGLTFSLERNYLILNVLLINYFERITMWLGVTVDKDQTYELPLVCQPRQLYQLETFQGQGGLWL